jgi:tetratricopeptide (TPR) repeat protein
MVMEKPQYLELEKQGAHDWAFNYPPEWEFFGYRLDKVEVADGAGDKDQAVQICLDLIESCPEYLPAVNKLGLLFKERGDLDGAIASFESAAGVGLACLPAGFEQGVDSIPWHFEDNRAFLLALEHLGVCYLEKALDAFEDLFELSPGYRGFGDLLMKLREICGVEQHDRK